MCGSPAHGGLSLGAMDPGNVIGTLLCHIISHTQGLQPVALFMIIEDERKRVKEEEGR
jgi:hypothetical protein